MKRIDRSAAKLVIVAMGWGFGQSSLADQATYLPDVNGHLWKVTTPNWQVEYLYDAVGNVSTIHRTVFSATPIALLAAHSRKTHGLAGVFDVPINLSTPISGAIDVEPRQIGNGHLIAFQFSGPVTSFGAVTAVNPASTPIGTASAVASGNEILVTLTGIPDISRITVSIAQVNGNGAPVSASIGFLIGDQDNSGGVNGGDISVVRARSGQSTNGINFRGDFDASGSINGGDVSVVRARSGNALP